MGSGMGSHTDNTFSLLITRKYSAEGLIPII